MSILYKKCWQKVSYKESFFKLYLFDVGVLGALSGLAVKSIMDYDFGTYKGYVAENLKQYSALIICL
jgi:hypothetical protein